MARFSKLLNDFDYFMSKRFLSDKVHKQKGNSPEFKLRSLILMKKRRLCRHSLKVALVAGIL